jgi:hypothetical protein
MNYIRLGLIAGAAGLLAWFAITVRGWHRDAGKLPQAIEDARLAARALDSYKADMRAELQRITDNATGYHNELEKLRADRGKPVTLRVCNVTPASAPALPSAVTPGTGADAPPASAGDLSGAVAGDSAAGFDAGPDLEQLARDADGTLAWARALQDYIRTLPASCAG